MVISRKAYRIFIHYGLKKSSLSLRRVKSFY